MKPFVYRTILAFGALALLGGCVTLDTDSWFGQKTVDRNTATSQTDEMPPPKAAPTQPVQSVTLPYAQQQTAQQLAQQPRPPAQQSLLAQNGALQAPAASAAPPGKVKVAVLLPLSGTNANLGHAMLNAAQMAVFDMSGGSFELMPRDTDGSEASGVAAARDAIGSGAQLLIGPLFGAQVAGVRSVAEPAGISVLTLSTDTSLAAPGVFVMGFAPSPQVDRVIGYAASQGLKHFAAIVPDNPYGALVSQAFQNAVARANGSVVDLRIYDPALHNSANAVMAIAPYRDRIDAVFLPEGGDEIAAIAQQMVAVGFDNRRVRLLGTGLWDEPGLAQRVNFLISGWFAASDPAARQNFVSAYTHAYEQEPPRLATLAYDATALAAVLARRGEHFDRAALTNPNGFAGIDGIFRLTGQGLVERGLAVDEITLNGNKVISPAPVTFAEGH